MDQVIVLKSLTERGMTSAADVKLIEEGVRLTGLSPKWIKVLLYMQLFVFKTPPYA